MQTDKGFSESIMELYKQGTGDLFHLVCSLYNIKELKSSQYDETIHQLLMDILLQTRTMADQVRTVQSAFLAVQKERSTIDTASAKALTKEEVAVEVQRRVSAKLV